MQYSGGSIYFVIYNGNTKLCRWACCIGMTNFYSSSFRLFTLN